VIIYKNPGERIMYNCWQSMPCLKSLIRWKQKIEKN